MTRITIDHASATGWQVWLNDKVAISCVNQRQAERLALKYAQLAQGDTFMEEL